MLSGLRSLSVLLLLALAPAYCTPPGLPCSRPAGETSTCVCQTADGVVDLRDAASDNGVARYKGMEDPNNFVYEYNPCFPFSTVGECSNVHLCQESKDIPPSTYKIADAGTEQIFLDTSTGQNVLTVFYTSQDGFGTYREVNVHLECDKSVKDPVVTTTGDSIAIFTYDVSFRSCHACPGGCGGSGGFGGGGGTAPGIVGLVLMILLIVGFVSYFVIGAIIMNVIYQKSGKEMIPQKNFWFALPGLVKAGFIFTFKPIYDFIRDKTGRSDRSGYKQEL